MTLPVMLYQIVSGSHRPRIQVAETHNWVDDPKIVDGAPCSIQIAGRRLQDEELLAAAGTISEVLSS